jgi:hypothetical protein
MFSLSVAAQNVQVSTVSQLESAIATANSAGGGQTILLSDGIYTLNSTLYVNAPNITIAGLSADRTKVIIQGDAMSSSARVGTVIRVAGSNFTLRDVTLQKSKYHLLQIVGENNADGAVIRNCIMRDAYEQMLKVSIDPGNMSVTADNGLVENCLFEYTAGMGPQYYIGGVDAHGAKNWVVRRSTFRNISSPNTAAAEYAVHFWNGAANNTVEKNLIVNCDRGIGFGMQGAGTSGGVIRNNMVYHAAGGGPYADVGIALAESRSAQVYNNTVLLENDFPWTIEYRFAATTGVLVANNLTNKQIISRDGATGTISANVTSATTSWFSNASTGNLHLASAVAAVIDRGIGVSGLVDDFDGQSRLGSPSIDVGADEYGASTALAAPMPPSDVRVD